MSFVALLVLFLKWKKSFSLFLSFWCRRRLDWNVTPDIRRIEQRKRPSFLCQTLNGDSGIFSPTVGGNPAKRLFFLHPADPRIRQKQTFLFFPPNSLSGFNTNFYLRPTALHAKTGGGNAKKKKAKMGKSLILWGSSKRGFAPHTYSIMQWCSWDSIPRTSFPSIPRSSAV